MKSTFWMPAQEAEDEIKRREAIAAKIHRELEDLRDSERGQTGPDGYYPALS